MSSKRPLDARLCVLFCTLKCKLNRSTNVLNLLKSVLSMHKRIHFFPQGLQKSGPRHHLVICEAVHKQKMLEERNLQRDA